MCFWGSVSQTTHKNEVSGFHSLYWGYPHFGERYPICCQNCSESALCTLSAVMVQLVSLWPRHPAFTIRKYLTLLKFVDFRSKSEKKILAGRKSRSPCEITPRCRVFISPEGRALSNGTTRFLWFEYELKTNISLTTCDRNDESRLQVLFRLSHLVTESLF